MGRGAKNSFSVPGSTTVRPSGLCTSEAPLATYLQAATPTELVVSGGGLHNLTLMSHLRRLFGKLKVMPLGDLGFDPDAKEAVIFAVLANETIHGVPNNLPGATGAGWPVVLGKVSP